MLGLAPGAELPAAKSRNQVAFPFEAGRDSVWLPGPPKSIGMDLWRNVAGAPAPDL